MLKAVSPIFFAFALSGALVPFLMAPAGAEELHHPAKGAGVHGGGSHGGAFHGGGGVGVVGGILGLAAGAVAIDAIANANRPVHPPGCYYEIQPLFDADGNQVSTHRVRVCY